NKGKDSHKKTREEAPEVPQNEAYNRYLSQMQNAPYSAPQQKKIHRTPPNHLQGNALQSKLGTKIGSTDEDFGYAFQEKRQNQQQNHCCCNNDNDKHTDYPEPNINEHGGVGLAYRSPVLTSVLDMPFLGKGARWGMQSPKNKKGTSKGVKIEISEEGLTQNEFLNVVLKGVTDNVNVDSEGYLYIVDSQKMNEFDKTIQPYLENTKQTISLRIVKDAFLTEIDDYYTGKFDIGDFDTSIYTVVEGSLPNAINVFRGASIIHVLAERFSTVDYEKKRERYNPKSMQNALNNEYLTAHFEGLKKELAYIKTVYSEHNLNITLRSPAMELTEENLLYGTNESELQLSDVVNINRNVHLKYEKYVYDYPNHTPKPNFSKYKNYEDFCNKFSENLKDVRVSKFYVLMERIQTEGDKQIDITKGQIKGLGNVGSVKISLCFKP
ncbi:MAG: hypothetical protein ACKVTZ_00430, partial [Bacteroidia bacterium]